MKPALALLLVALAAAMAFTASPAYAQMEMTELEPADGARLDAPPDPVHMCFSQRLDIRDRGPSRFSYVPPDGMPLGFRVLYYPDHLCADIIPGLPDDPPDGVYTIEWHVTSEDGSEEASGELHYQVGEGGATTPTASATPSATATAPAGGGNAEKDTGGGGPDILLTALLTIAVAGGAAVVATLGYVLRRKIGFDPHRPPKDEGGGGAGH